MKLTVILKKGEKQYVALCPEIDVVSQGYSIEEAINNLREAIDLYIDVMGLPEGIGRQEQIITSIEVMTHAKITKALG